MRTGVPEECIKELWQKRWDLADTRYKNLVNDPSLKVPGWDLTRTRWTTLNSMRMEQGDVITCSINVEWLTLHYANMVICNP